VAGQSNAWIFRFSTARRWCLPLSSAPTPTAGRDKDKKKKDAKKEDRAAFLARTQAQRESRQHTRQENHAAGKMQAMLRRSKDLTAVRQGLLARLEEAMQAEPAPTWQYTSSLVRLVCLARPGGPPRKELLPAVKALLTSLTNNSGEDNYIRVGLREHAGVVQLQLKRICGYVVVEMVRCRWTLQASDHQEEDAALLKALFVLSDASQWKAAAGIPIANKVCSELVGSLVVPRQRGSIRASPSTVVAAGGSFTMPQPASAAGGAQRQTTTAHAGGLYESLRQVLCPTEAWKGAKGTVQAPLLWTLAIRPLTAGFPSGDARQVWVAFAFAREFLSIPALLSEIPEVLRQAVLHQSVWPRIVFSLGTAAQIHPNAGGGGEWLPEERIMNVFANVVELTHKTPTAGLQLLYLSALQRLVEVLPGGALSERANAAKVKQLEPLQSPDHVQWLLCGLGGEPRAAGEVEASTKSGRPADAGGGGGGGPGMTQP
jgi:hypothetical protein